MTIDGLLRLALIDALEARVLIAHALQCSRVQLVIRSQDALSNEEVSNISALFLRRMEGEPVAYITGEREFFGLNFRVTPDVLIPRPDTELLVELAEARLPRQGSVLDMGTGSGAVAVSLAHLRRDARVTATDISETALVVAQHNASTHGVDVQFLQSDWYDALQGQFDLIVSNPPYIAAGDPHLQQGDLRFEPPHALTDARNGLSALSAIIQGAPRFLKPGGWLLLEHGYDQADAVAALLRKAGWDGVQSWPDLAGILRVSGASLPAK